MELSTADALTSVWNEVGGVRIHGVVSTTPAAPGPTIVFVHGLGVSTRYMEPTMARLAATHPVAGLDLPGFGRSGSPRRILSVRGLVDAMTQWLDARGIGPAVFVGNSFGCQLIVDCVARDPTRALGLVLNAPTIDPAHRSAVAMIARVAADVPKEPLSLAMIVARDYLRAGPVRILRTLRVALDDRIEEKLPGIVVPVAVVCGAHDPVVTVPWCEEVTQLVGRDRPGAAGATLRVVHDASHALPYDDPGTFAAIIEDFMHLLPSHVLVPGHG